MAARGRKDEATRDGNTDPCDPGGLGGGGVVPGIGFETAVSELPDDDAEEQSRVSTLS
jgi:hypothetical protein